MFLQKNTFLIWLSCNLLLESSNANTILCSCLFLTWSDLLLAKPLFQVSWFFVLLCISCHINNLSSVIFYKVSRWNRSKDNGNWWIGTLPLKAQSMSLSHLMFLCRSRRWTGSFNTLHRQKTKTQKNVSCVKW